MMQTNLDVIKMTPEQFVYWLQGFVDTRDMESPSQDQWRMICDHLALVFNKVTPIPPKGRILKEGETPKVQDEVDLGTTQMRIPPELKEQIKEIFKIREQQGDFDRKIKGISPSCDFYC